MRKQRRESRGIGTKASIRMPDVIAKMLILHGVDHRRVRVFGCTRRVGPRVVEEFTKKAGESSEVFSSHCAGFEDYQTPIVQKIAQGGTKLVIQRSSIESKSRNDRTERWLQLRDAHIGGHGGF